jgi:hypothetical protein
MNLNRAIREPKFWLKEAHQLIKNGQIADTVGGGSTASSASASAGGVDLFGARPSANAVYTPWAAGLVYNATLSTGAVELNTLSAYPVVIGKNCKLTAMKVSVSSVGASGSRMKLGLYAASGASSPSYPGALLAETGEIDTTATGPLTYTMASAVSLAPGLYFLAYLAGVAAPTVHRLHAGATLPILDVSGNSQAGWGVSYTYTAVLPGVYPVASPISGAVWNLSAWTPTAVFMRLEA